MVPRPTHLRCDFQGQHVWLPPCPYRFITSAPQNPRELAFDVPTLLCQDRAMLGETQNQFSLTPAASITGGVAKKQLPIIVFMKRVMFSAGFWFALCSLNPQPAAADEVPAQRQRIDALVATLERETWDQSVENLVTNQNQYYDLAAGATGAMFAEPELEEMLSVRRAIKVLNMLEARPMKQRLEGCRQLFDRVFRVHADEIERWMGLGKGPRIDRPWWHPPAHALCMAMFAAAETGRRDLLAEEFLRLDALRRRVEGLIADNRTACLETARIQGRSGDFEGWKTSMLSLCYPQPRSLLNVLRVAVSRDPHAPVDLLGKIDEYCRSVEMTATEVPIVPWNARTTCFEFRVGSAVDTSKGVTKYSFYDWGGETRQERKGRKTPKKSAILQKVRELAL